MGEKRGPWVEASPGEPAVNVAVRSLRQRLEAVSHYLPLAAARSDAGPKYVHQLRVWSRRAGAALAVFEDWLPRRRREWVRRQLKRVRRAANDARDCDVQAQRLAGHPAGPGARVWRHDLKRERTRAQGAIVAVAGRLAHKDCFARRVGGLLARVRVRGPGQEEAGRCLFGPWARDWLRPILDEFLAAIPADTRDAAALHRFRIRGKRLRYAVELLDGALPPGWRDTLYPTLEELQDRLGEINDRTTALARLDARIERAGRREAGPLRELRRHERHGRQAALAAYEAWLTPARLRGLREGLAALTTPPAPGGGAVAGAVPAAPSASPTSP